MKILLCMIVAMLVLTSGCTTIDEDLRNPLMDNSEFVDFEPCCI